MQKPIYTLEKPHPTKDAPFAVAWFAGDGGNETLLAMGNAPEAIVESTLASETKTLEEFVTLEEQSKQLTWMVHADNKTIGAVWIELEDTDDVQAPAVHMMIGDSAYRGKGIGAGVLKDMLRYAYGNLPYAVMYSRHLVSNKPAAKLLKKAGFEPDEKPYSDENNLEWQNVKLTL